MRTMRCLTAMFLFVVGLSVSRVDGGVQLLFRDNFNTADTNNFDAATLTGRRDGTLASTVYLRSARTQQAIAGNQLQMVKPSAGGGGRVRFQNADGWFNWATNATGTTITNAGRLRVEFDWTASATDTANWVAFSIGHSDAASGEPFTRVNHAQTDYGLLLRGNGGSQRFDNGTGITTASFTPSAAPQHVTIDFAFGSFEDGTSVTGLALVDGFKIDTHAFTWSSNACSLYMELESYETGMLIDNYTVSAVSNFATACTLGYVSCAEGPDSGTDTVVLAVSPASASWLAASAAAWLHLPAAGGTGSTNLVFTFDANTGATRTGAVTVAGQTLRVIQAGAAYAAANPLTILSSSLNTPSSVAVDTNGNVYVCDYGNAVVQKWSAASKTFTTVIGSGLTQPYGVVVDASGNLYVSDLGDATIKKWTAATGVLTTLISSGLTYPTAVGVDTVGNVYVADYMDNALKKWSVATGALTTLASVAYPASLTVEGTNAVIFAYAGDDYNWRVGAWKIPSSEYIADIWTNMPSLFFWNPLTVTVSPQSGYLYAAYYGTDTLYWQQGDASHHWTSSGNWTNFSVSATSISALAATETGTLCFTDSDDLTLRKWTQTGIIDSVPTGTTSVLASPLLSSPHGIAVDARGGVFFSCNGNDLVGKWTPDGTVTTLVATGLSGPAGVALDSSGNLYIADAGDARVKRWNAASGTLTTQLVSGLSSPWAVAVDAATNLYVADTGTKTISKCTSGSADLTTVIGVPPDIPYGLGVDAAGNVYGLESYTEGNTLLQCRPGSTNLFTLFFDTTVLDGPHGIAVDGGGDVLIADTFNDAVRRWQALDGQFTDAVNGDTDLDSPYGVAVDADRNVYIADTSHNAIKEKVRAFVDASPVWLAGASGTGALTPVLPATVNLAGLFAPKSDQSWLTITGVTNGVVSYSYTAASIGSVAHVTFLGQTVTVTRVLSEIAVLGTNGATIASGETSSAAKGTDFGFVGRGFAMTNTLTMTNSGLAALTLTGWAENGPNDGSFDVLGVPASIAAGGSTDIRIVFAPDSGGASSNQVSFTNAATNTPFLLNLVGSAPYLITPSVGANGTLSPADAVSVLPGGTTGIVARSDTYYHVGTLLTNGIADAQAVGTAAYTSRWTNVSSDGTLQVAFAANVAALGTPEWWLAKYGWTSNFGAWETLDADGDGLSAWQEYVADTDPTNAVSGFAIASMSNALPPCVFFNSSTGRLYTLIATTNLASGSWSDVSGAGPRLGTGGTDALRDTNSPPSRAFYKVRVNLP